MSRNTNGLYWHTFILLILITIISGGIAFGQPSNTRDKSKKNHPTPSGGKASWLKTQLEGIDTEFSLTTGLRTDDLSWSIAGNGINVLSELTWSNVDSYQITLENRTQLKNNIYSRSAFSYAIIQDGKVQDSDYGLDNYGGEWSRSMSESPGDELYDISFAGGYSFFFLEDRLTLSPLIGLSYHKQNLRIQNGYQTVSGTNPFGGSNPPAVGPLSSNLDSSYFARWLGPWIGCDLQYRLKKLSPGTPDMKLRFSLELHWADYYAEGNWNLRGDLQHPKSFEHEANGFGVCLNGQWLIKLAENWDITFSATHQNWSTGSGTDRKFLSGGGTSTTELNEVNWDSTSFMVGALYRF